MASFVSKLSIHALVTQSSSNRMTTNEVTPLDLLFSIHSLWYAYCTTPLVLFTCLLYESNLHYQLLCTLGSIRKNADWEVILSTPIDHKIKKISKKKKRWLKENIVADFTSCGCLAKLIFLLSYCIRRF